MRRAGILKGFLDTPGGGQARDAAAEARSHDPLGAGAPELLRNTDIRTELERLNSVLTFEWIENASRGLDQVQTGMRRNLLRGLSLDAFASGLASSR